jgi:hypothetical protein
MNRPTRARVIHSVQDGALGPLCRPRRPLFFLAQGRLKMLSPRTTNTALSWTRHVTVDTSMLLHKLICDNGLCRATPGRHAPMPSKPTSRQLAPRSRSGRRSRSWDGSGSITPGASDPSSAAATALESNSTRPSQPAQDLGRPAGAPPGPRAARALKVELVLLRAFAGLISAQVAGVLIRDIRRGVGLQRLVELSRVAQDGMRVRAGVASLAAGTVDGSP